MFLHLSSPFDEISAAELSFKKFSYSFEELLFFPSFLLDGICFEFLLLLGFDSCYQFHPPVFYGINEEVYDFVLYFEHF